MSGVEGGESAMVCVGPTRRGGQHIGSRRRWEAECGNSTRTRFLHVPKVCQRAVECKCCIRPRNRRGWPRDPVHIMPTPFPCTTAPAAAYAATTLCTANELTRPTTTLIRESTQPVSPHSKIRLIYFTMLGVHASVHCACTCNCGDNPSLASALKLRYYTCILLAMKSKLPL